MCFVSGWPSMPPQSAYRVRMFGTRRRQPANSAPGATSPGKSAMSGRFFLDTNLLIYAIDATDPDKQAVAQDWMAAAHESGDGVVSYQVVQEWFNVVLRKAAVPLSTAQAVTIYQRLIEPLWRIQSSRE